MRGTILTGAVVCAAMLCGCSAADEVATGEEVDVVMNELDLYEGRNDPATPGGPVTVCTVGGVTMHCCPNWQAGRTHYVMTGVDLATNTFRCARLRSDIGIHSQAVTLAPATQSFLTDQTLFRPACPSGQAMVGLHFDLKRAACTPVDGGGLALITYTSSLLQNGLRHCGPAFTDTSLGSFMWGIGLTNPTRLLCKH